MRISDWSSDVCSSDLLAAADMQRVDALIRRRLSSDVVLINQIADHIIAGGGKRLRPMLHVLAAGAAGYHGEHHVKLAAIIEFIHRSEEHTSELQSLMRISYAVFCLKKKKKKKQ